MNATQPMTLAEAIQHAGEGWLIDAFSSTSEAGCHFGGSLAAINERGRSRLGDNAPSLTEAAVLEEYSRNPQRVRAFFQALGKTRSPDMLLMVWRIIQGMEIKEITLSYHRQKDFQVNVILESPAGDVDAPYVSSNIRDFALIRHFGIMKVNENPIFDGFYALRVG